MGYQMIFNRIFYIAITLAFIHSGLSAAQDRPGKTVEEAIKAITSDFFARISEGHYIEAANLFHFPPTFTPGERSKDVAAVAATLAILTKEFGIPNEPKPNDSTALWYSIGAGSAHLAYWQNYPYSVDLRLRVKFSREGPGYMVVKFSKIEGVIEIRNVDYGLPADGPGAIKRIKEIFEILNKEKGYLDRPHDGSGSKDI
jgi:hypothetical protein